MATDYTPVYDQATVHLVQSDFPLLRDPHRPHVYVDNTAASLYSKSQMASVYDDFSSHIYCNPHTNFGHTSPHLPDIQPLIREARQIILRFFNTSESTYTVIFTSGATASLKLVADTYRWSDRPYFAYLDQCHTSVVGMRELAHSHLPLSPSEVPERLSSQPSNKKGIFAFSAMSNFCGSKFPMKNWTELAHGHDWHVLLDAATLVSTNPLDLTDIQPDFVVLSFYKLFGYPTGIGALLVKNSSLNTLNKKYFGGGTVEMNLTREKCHVAKKACPEDYFEDGTLPYLSILALRHGFDSIKRIGMYQIALHTFSLAKFLYNRLIRLKYDNGQPVVELYVGPTGFDDFTKQGGMLNFNILRPDGSHFGFTEFRKIAIHNHVVVRVGCFCNIGACQTYLGITDEDVKSNHAAGHVCGDNIDVMGGKPTGSIRVSFGYYSLKQDADKVVALIEEHFLNAFQTRRENMIHYGHQLKVSAIYLYPIKSCGPMRVKSKWPLASSSLLYDRQFVIMQGRSCLTQKNLPLLCQIRPDIDLESKTMTLTLSGCPVLRISIGDGGGDKSDMDICVGKVCGDKIEGIDCGQEAAEWLEQATGLTGLRLVRLTHRSSKETTKKLQSFANEAQFLVLNRSSALKLQENMMQEENTDWLLEQFRGNIVLEGGNPFEEDAWKHLQIGDVILDVIGPCTRCNIIGVNQTSSEKVQEPLQTLAKMEGRRFKFGILAGSQVPMDEKSLAIGTSVQAHY